MLLLSDNRRNIVLEMKIHSRLQTWYMVTILFILFALIALSFSISVQVENLFADYRSSVDKIGLDQAQETFNFLDSTAQDIVLKIHSNPPTTLLSLAPSIEKVSPMFIRSFLQMRDMVLPFVKSINVIHVPTGKIITTNQGWTRVTGSLIEDLESAYPDLPLLTPLPLETITSVDNKKELVFAYLFRDKLPGDKGLTRGVILLIDPSWFLNAVSRTDDERTGTKFFIYHPSLGVLGEDSSDPFIKSLSKNIRFTIDDNPHSGSITDSTEPDKYVIDYQVLGDSELYLLRLRDETILQKELFLLRVKISGIAVVFLIIVIIGALLVNKQVYNPFNLVVSEIRESMGDRLSIPENDLDLLNALYGTLRDEYSDSGEDRIINNCLRSLTQEDLETPIEIIEILKKRGINLTEEKPGCLCLISIDDMDEEFTIQPSEAISSYTSLKFQLKNSSSKALSELRLGWTAVFLRRGVMLLLLYSTENGISPNKATVAVFHRMICDFMDVSISMVQSEQLVNLEALRQKYLILSMSLRRRYLLGRGVYLNEINEQKAPDNEERKDIRKLRLLIIKSISDQMEFPAEFKSYINKLKTWLVSAVQDEINAFSLNLTRQLSDKDADFQTQDLFKSLINQPTLDDFYTIVEAFAAENEGNFQHTESRHSALIDLARNMVETNYSDVGLCLTSVATELKMSPTYFGMIFKKAVSTTFSDYLTMVRIQEAARLLRSSQDSVQEIMVSVGIPSESTFYRRFREIFNLTPQLYRQKIILKPGEIGKKSL
ncbi:helix-turn-helix transcriptional regulator [Oceanispirochaeta sp. M1]|uniref:helix-turn-helix transcriptional regulator n=2 Tax=Oceanispirochaeta TaxID=2035349 RepID=UPI0014951672